MLRDENSTSVVRRVDRCAAALALGLLAGCVMTPPRPAPGPDGGSPAVAAADATPRGALLRFTAAARAGDFETAWTLLDGPLRARYTPSRLAEDLSLVRTAAEERLARAELAARAEPRITGDRAEFIVGSDHAVRLVREAGAWRVSALE